MEVLILWLSKWRPFFKDLFLTEANAIVYLSIIFVHGIQGHPYSTWTYKEKTTSKTSGDKSLIPHPSTIRSIFRRRSPAPRSPSPDPASSASKQTREEHAGSSQGIFWPGDLLPKDQASVRILTCGYDSHVSHFFEGPTSQMNIYDHARNLLNQIVDERVTCVRT
jgi:hypothetical protein